MIEETNKNRIAQELWKKVLIEIQLEENPMLYSTLKANVIPKEITNDSLFLTCDNKIVQSGISKNIRVIKEAIKKVEGKNLEIITTIEKILKTQKVEEKDIPLFIDSKDAEERLKEKRHKTGLNSKYTFENYIMGENNQLAYAIATAVAQRPGEIYNPVFVYSGVGLGKTHLLQAIGNRILEKKPTTKVVYTTGEQFTNELIESIQSGKGRGTYASNQFRAKFRNADVLLIDDIQFIIGKEKTQEEFFHTFNSLHMSEKQIVITSDRPPKDFDRLPDRITSRFNSGIIADIQPPTLETREAILRTKRDLNKDPISNDVISFVAQAVDTNVREMEGAYMQVLTYALSKSMVATKEMAAHILGKTVKEKVSKNINMNQILNAVCSYYSVKSIDIKGKRRTKDIVIPRQVAMYLIKELTDTPFMTIGDFLGGRDHTTIMHGAEKVEKEAVSFGKIKQDIVNVKKIIEDN